MLFTSLYCYKSRNGFKRDDIFLLCRNVRIFPLIKGWNFAVQNIEDIGISIILMVDHM